MDAEHDKRDELSPEELEDESAEQLPDREAMSLVDLGGPLGGPMPIDPVAYGEESVDPPPVAD